MISLFSKRKNRTSVPEQIYGIVVAQARDERFFTDFGIEDTVMGRFDVLALHVFLFSRRMKEEGGKTAIDLSQEVFDLFVADVDRALRQIGIGDTSVPKRKKKMVRSFYGQIEDFDRAMDDGDAQLLKEKVRTRYFSTDEKGYSGLLVEYMLETSAKLSELTLNVFTTGQFEWPTVDRLGK